MGSVTVRNYMFPIIFTYKGWVVTLHDASSFFQSSDVKVKVVISVDRRPYDSWVYEFIRQIEQNLQSQYGRWGRNKIDDYPELLEKYKKMSDTINELFDSKKPVEYIEKANGGYLDRFLGQNLSAVEKIQQKVKSYIDSNLGVADFRNELVEVFKRKGI